MKNPRARLVFAGYATDLDRRRCELLDRRSAVIGHAEESADDSGVFTLEIGSLRIVGKVVMNRRSEIIRIRFEDADGNESGRFREEGAGWRFEWKDREMRVRRGHVGATGRSALFFGDVGAPGLLAFGMTGDTETSFFLPPRNLVRVLRGRPPVITDCVGSIGHPPSEGVLPVVIAFRMFHRGGCFGSAG